MGARTPRREVSLYLISTHLAPALVGAFSLSHLTSAVRREGGRTVKYSTFDIMLVRGSSTELPQNGGKIIRLSIHVSDHLKTYIFERLPTACCRIRGLRGSGIAGNGSIHRLYRPQTAQLPGRLRCGQPGETITREP